MGDDSRGGGEGEGRSVDRTKNGFTGEHCEHSPAYAGADAEREARHRKMDELTRLLREGSQSREDAR